MEGVHVPHTLSYMYVVPTTTPLYSSSLHKRKAIGIGHRGVHCASWEVRVDAAESSSRNF